MKPSEKKHTVVPQAIIYDLDGTLVDSKSIVLDILFDVAVEFDFNIIDDAFIGNALSLGGNNMISKVFGVSDQASKVPLKRFREIYSSTVISEKSLYPCVMDTLNMLRDMGIRLCVCTNKPRNLALASLEQTKLSSLFEFVVAGDDLPTKKPCCENVEYCLGRFDLPADVSLYVGDSLVDQQAADHANVQFCFFSGGYNDGVNVSSALFTFDSHFDFELWCRSLVEK